MTDTTGPEGNKTLGTTLDKTLRGIPGRQPEFDHGRLRSPKPPPTARPPSSQWSDGKPPPKAA